MAYLCQTLLSRFQRITFLTHYSKRNNRQVIWNFADTFSANWVNQLQPLYIAGAVFANKSSSLSACPDSSDDQVRFSPSSIISIIRQNIPSHRARSNLEEEYATEKILLLKHLARIENETGWKTSDRAADLRKLWGF